MAKNNSPKKVDLNTKAQHITHKIQNKIIRRTEKFHAPCIKTREQNEPKIDSLPHELKKATSLNKKIVLYQQRLCINACS